VTGGDRYILPAAAARSAAGSSSAAELLSTKPAAPLASASSMYSSSPNVVSMRTAVLDWRPISRRAASPSITGIRMSSSTTSGRCRMARSRACTPLPASATISTPGMPPRIRRMPPRVSSSSSAIRMRSGRGSADIVQCLLGDQGSVPEAETVARRPLPGFTSGAAW
jgi:hypothetical protein